MVALETGQPDDQQAVARASKGDIVTLPELWVHKKGKVPSAYPVSIIRLVMAS